MDYDTFLAAKAQVADEVGVPTIDPADINPMLKPHQRDAVLWAVRGGRRAMFASFGLGKTIIQLEAVRLTMRSVGPHARGLIVLPLGVRQEFVKDARMIGIDPPRFVRSHLDATEPGIWMTNYESIREGKFDPTGFDVVSLDEAAILRGFGGTKTFRELMRLYEGSSAYRFVATATPSPNDYIELLAYAAFLDVLDVGQAKTRFFKRDSEHADRLTLLPHMEHEFWMWVASWALFISKPSDLGYPDDGYELPELEVVWHQVPAAGIDVPRADRDPGRVLRDILTQCGHGAAGKHLPAVAFTLPAEQASALLDGYLSGDGHYREDRHRWMASSVSKPLLLGIAYLAHRVHGATASVYPGRPERDGTIDGRDVHMSQDWILSFDLPGDRAKRPAILGDGAWLKVRSAEPAGVAETWNLRVEEDESYTAEGMVVKNCPLQFDIVDRLIGRWSNPGDTILDPFGGIMTVPYCSIRQGRSAVAVELNPTYWADGVMHVQGVANEIATPTLFDLDEDAAA